MLFRKYPEFITVTCLHWLPLLERDAIKDIFIASLANLVSRRIVSVFAFVIMPNHVHMIWCINDGFERADVQRDLLKFTARAILSYLQTADVYLYHQLRVDDADRKYQVWERNSLSIPIFCRDVAYQKLNYIHNNPVKAGLTHARINYQYSTAAFYETKEVRWPFLSHIKESFIKKTSRRH
jgi:putative transposase